MPNITQETKLQAPLEVALTMAYPSMICGVGRKVNTGNYENIDVLCGLTVPVTVIPTPDQVELFKEMATAAAEIGFGIASKETWERYKIIKEAQKAQQEASQ